MYREFLKSISYIGNLNCFVYNRVTYSWNILFILINDTGQQFSKVICFGNELRFVAMATYLIPSFSLFVLGGSHCWPLSQTKFRDLQSQKCSKWLHPIVNHQRVWWHHYCHSNLGSESTGHQLVKIPMRWGGRRWVARMKGSGLYLAKRGCDEITSSFLATRTALIPSIHPTPPASKMVSVDYELVSYFNYQHPSYWSARRREVPWCKASVTLLA